MVTKDFHPNEGLETRDHASLKAVQDYDVLLEKLLGQAGPELTYHTPERDNEQVGSIDLTNDSDMPPADDSRADDGIDGMKLAEFAETRGESTLPAASTAANEKLTESKPKATLVNREVWLDDEPQQLGTVVMVDGFRYSRQACDAVICRKVLPLKVVRNAICVGLTCKRPMGAHGEPVITAPFAFASEIVRFNRFDIGRHAQLYCAKVRPMASLLTGREEMMVAWDENDRFGTEVVWFPLEMVPDLLTEPKMEDMATMVMLRWVEKHVLIIRRMAYGRDEYRVVEIPLQQSLPAPLKGYDQGSQDDPPATVMEGRGQVAATGTDDVGPQSGPT